MNSDTPFAQASRAGSVLASARQTDIETRALAILQRPEVAVANARIKALFDADTNAALPNQTALIQQSADEHCYHAALMAASETPSMPYFTWTLAIAHQWQGVAVPGSRFGQDNPDNVYRFASISADMCYTISGHFKSAQPADFSICALPTHVGDGIAANVCGIITRDSIDIDADGRFSIVVDNSPSDGRRNHLCIAGAKVLMARDTLADWALERPCELRVQRTDGAAVDDFELGRGAARAAELAYTIAEFFLRVVQHGMCEIRSVNELAVPESSAARGGLVTQTATVGYYHLPDNYAWVISIDPLAANYLGVQLCDMWLLSYDYRRHSSSLNHHQAMADTDGRVRLLVSAQDPGVHNWLDSGGHRLGTILLRWQGLPPDADLANCLTSEVVRLTDLPRYLPASTRYLSAAEREQQREQRLAGYHGRVYA